MTTAVLDTTANDIIKAALLDSKIIRPDQVPTDADTSTALARLNTLTKRWQAQGHHLWSQTEGIAFLDVGQESVLLGPDGDEATTTEDFVPATTTAALAGGETVIPLDSTAGMSGAPELITINPFSAQFWQPLNSAILTFPGLGSSINQENGAAVAAFSSYVLTTTPGDDYRVTVDYVQGTSSGARFEIFDPVTLATIVFAVAAADGTFTLDFTATQENLDFLFINTSNGVGDDNSLTRISLINKTSGDYFSVRLNDNTRQWTRIVEVIDATSVEINDPIPGEAASGAQVFTFTDLIERPMAVYNPRSRTVGLDNEIPIEMWSRQEYMQQPTKSSQGTPVQLYYSRQRGNGQLFVWQTAQNVNQIVEFTFDRPLQVSQDQIDAPDFPSEWFDALKWNLAKELMSGYSVPPDTAQMILLNAQTSLDEALDFDEEYGSLYLQPNYRG